MNNDLNQKPLVTAGVFMGIGLGGFFDGILFHQLLQIHNMLSAKYPKTSIANMEINMFWDGLFHSLTYTMTLIGLMLLWSQIGRSASSSALPRWAPRYPPGSRRPRSSAHRAVGAIAMATVVSRHCPLTSPSGLNTCRK